MKMTINIQSVSHEDLVNLLATAIYGSYYLMSNYLDSALPEEGETHEDILAHKLLNGNIIAITDYNAEGEAYGNLPHIVNDDYSVSYFVTLENIRQGLEKAANGTFSIPSGDDEELGERQAAQRAFGSFGYDNNDFDQIRADVLMQIILFNEIIYG